MAGLHKIAFPADTPLPREALVLRRVRECAALASGVDVRSLAALLVSRPPPVIAAGMVVGPSSGRVRRARRKAASEQATLESVLRRS